MTDYNALIARLKFLSTDTPRKLMCQGCGFERNCGTEGCAILRDAIATMEQLHKDCSGMCDCCTHGSTPCDQPPCAKCFDARRGYQTVNWQWRGVQEKNGGQSDE